MSVTGTTASTLIAELLSSVDSYNSGDVSDVTTVGTQGYQALLALNQGLQKIYSILKEYNILDKEAVNATLATTASQDYVDITGITDLDDIESIYEASNDITLKRITFAEYRRLANDPSETTGNPTHYVVRGTDRILLYPRPDAIYTLSIWYKFFKTKMSATSSTTGVPAKFDAWIVAEARVFWQLAEDASDTAKVSSFKAIADEMREVSERDLASEFDLSEESESHWGDGGQSFPRFDSPVGS